MHTRTLAALAALALSTAPLGPVAAQSPEATGNAAWITDRVSDTVSILTDPDTGCQYLLYRVDSGELSGTKGPVTLPARAMSPRFASAEGKIKGCGK